MRRATALLLAAVLAVMLSACKTSSSKREYVALGDSYTAGPLIGRADGRDGCVRSKNNYPHLLAKKADLDLTDVSCSAAPTDAVEGEQTIRGRSIRPQIEAVDETTDLVTIGLGLNDLGLSVRVFITCVQLGASDPGGAPCTEADQAAGANGIQAALDQMPDRLGGVVDAVAERAPDADVVLVGYPTIFPDEGTCADLGIAAGDIPLVRNVVESINATAAAVAEQRGATYLDTATPSHGHDICADDPWIAGIAPAQGRRGLAWHPYAEEQAMVADLLADVVAGLD
ncbi:SGNH/GDSL hydrolase family protein [Nocardioides humi]|uniref:SGNH/GDSL hydrolase family protein n=1 Tax=Nocardioides humi TaxID=449461 RepID=A0ABN2AI89_9ACTN|nr:SGNH/GDSL hydrolase family protein [Nocardioides humi]